MKKLYLSQARASSRATSWLRCALVVSSLQCLLLMAVMLSPAWVLPYLRVAPYRHDPPNSSGMRTNIFNRHNVSLAMTPEERLDGVAVTLMLHAPRWFQRRYTVMVQNILANLPPRWRVQIFSTGRPDAGLQINPGLGKLIENGMVQLTVLPPALQHMRKKELMTHEWLWENMIADKVLVFGGNSVICGNSVFSLHDFTHFDWVGSPWEANGGRGGEGGISIRSRNVMLQTIRRELQKSPEVDSNKLRRDWGYEDSFFVSRLVQMEREGVPLRIADRNTTLMFASSGKYVSEGSFAAFMTLADLDYQRREDFLSYCLELKVIFPSLHDPNCFGAHPNPELCKKSICALQEPLVGGC